MNYSFLFFWTFEGNLGFTKIFAWMTNPLLEAKSAPERLHRKVRQSELELSIEASQTKDIKFSRSAHLLLHWRAADDI